MEGGKEIKHRQEARRGHLEILQNEDQNYILYNNSNNENIFVICLLFFKLVKN